MLRFQLKALHPSKKPTLSLPTARKLNKEQAAVLSAVLSGKNVFFTGSAGSYLPFEAEVITFIV